VKNLLRDFVFPLALVLLVSFPRDLLEGILAQRSAFTLFTLAVMGSAWRGGLKSGLVATFLADLAGFFFFLRPFGNAPGQKLIEALQVILFSIAGVGISWIAEQLRVARVKAEASKRQAEDALAQVKVLRGLLPICANCKRIRDTEGNWHQIEAYIRRHSAAEFSHGICSECLRLLYPEIANVK
jgi:K+-sensing histidine kinase KdpD